MTRPELRGPAVPGASCRGAARGFGAVGATEGTPAVPWIALSAAPVDELIKVMAGGSIVFGAAPGAAVVTPTARSDRTALPLMEGFGPGIRDLDWQAAVCLQSALSF